MHCISQEIDFSKAFFLKKWKMHLYQSQATEINTQNARNMNEFMSKFKK